MIFTHVGTDTDFHHVTVPSETRPNVEHNLAISKRDGSVSCTCEDAQVRKKSGSIVDGSATGCKHIVALQESMRRSLEDAL